MKRKLTVKKYLSHEATMVELQKRADSYAQSLRLRVMSQTVDMRIRAALEPLIVDFSRLMVAFAEHLGREK